MKKTKSLKTANELEEHGFISKEELPLFQEVAEKFNILVTPPMLSLMKDTDEHDPIRRQFLPNLEELNEDPIELEDPTGDQQHEVIKGVVHRYPDRCLLKVVSVCPIYCRFCFRKELIGPRKASLTESELTAAYDYIKNQTGIWEVILTGGDPLILKPRKLAEILMALERIEHLEIIRIHTRIPVVDPSRINHDLAKALKISKPVYVVLHANHPKEFTRGAQEACALLVDAGIPMLSQSVLLKGVNDDAEILGQLMKTFVRNRIKPYYLHHPDLAKGTGHFRLSIEEGQRLVRSLQGKISGLCQPTYMLEIPGGVSKVPIGPGYIEKKENTWQVEDHTGKVHDYHD